MLHISPQNEDRAVKTAWTTLAALKQREATVLAFIVVLPEDTRERVGSLVTDKHQVR